VDRAADDAGEEERWGIVVVGSKKKAVMWHG
jgi:hypothetical protein